MTEHPFTLPQEIKDAAMDAGRAGFSGQEVSEMLGISLHTAYKWGAFRSYKGRNTSGPHYPKEVKEATLLAYSDGMSASEVAVLMGVTRETVKRWTETVGTYRAKKESERRGKPASQNPRGFGTLYAASSGYQRRSLHANYWLYEHGSFTVNNQGYEHCSMLEHRRVMAESLGRPLTEKETVHHINGDRSDNRLENLQLRSGPHGAKQAFSCQDCGSQNVLPVAIDA